LYTLLDESTTRVRTLIAAAGYGKTTLAEQWVARSGRRGVWFTARSASTDVAALALGVAQAASELIPDCDERLRAHLRAVPNPGERVHVLAEILGEELASWAATDWLVLDEYQELVGARDAELFVEELVACSPVQLLIASRLRPTWISSRSILYGDVLELNQTALAMDTHEAAELLAGRSGASASGLVALANGWPAVIALASMTQSEVTTDNEVPDSLYRFFAEEVFEALGESVRTGLASLAVAPTLDRVLATKILGQDVAETVFNVALSAGILEERDTRLELHPLARSFLVDRVGQVVGDEASGPAVTCYRHYFDRRDWDAAFEIIVKQGPAAELETLLGSAIEDLLDTARLSTLASWCDAADSAGVRGSIVAIARAEIALRQGRHAEAQAFAEGAAGHDDHGSTFRALSVAARAAHLASRDENALDLYKRAEAAATNDDERRDAVWGQLSCELELERPDAGSGLAEMSAGVPISDADQRLRSSSTTLLWQMRTGCMDLSEADVAQELLHAAPDPLTRSGFQSCYSVALALSARYDEALAVSSELAECASRYRFDFAAPYASISAAMANAGLRRFDEAARHLREAVKAARIGRDLYAQQLAFAVEVRTLAAQGKHELATAQLVPDLRSAQPAMRGEVLGSRALVLASAGRIVEAEELVSKIDGISKGVEVAVLCPAVRAASALTRRDRDLPQRVCDLEEHAFRTGAVDLLVASYRSLPGLLPVLLRVSSAPERLIDLIRRASDTDLARVVGQPVDIPDDPIDRLSKRERDVYELLCQGLQNAQIGQILFISEATVKVHVQHIFDKLGVRSRTALAVHAALRQSGHATAARVSSTDASS